jgi:tripartite-type tricarboxylate transporter receptor subunit TctC
MQGKAMKPIGIANHVLHATLGTLFLVALSVLPAAAQLTGRPITIIVPYTPGTGIDILARALGAELTRHWGQPVVVDNKPGASGNIGTQVAARAAPDGQTLLMIAKTFVTNGNLFKNVPYDPVKSFAPVIKLATGSIVLAVHPSVPADSVPSSNTSRRAQARSTTALPALPRLITSPWSCSSTPRKPISSISRTRARPA